MAPRRPDREPALRPRPTLDFDPGPVAPWVAGRARARLPWPRPSARLRPPSGPAPRPGRPRPRDECCVERARGSQYPRPRHTGRQYPAPRPVSTRWHTGRQCPRATTRQYPIAHGPSVTPCHRLTIRSCFSARGLDRRRVTSSVGTCWSAPPGRPESIVTPRPWRTGAPARRPCPDRLTLEGAGPLDPLGPSPPRPSRTD